MADARTRLLIDVVIKNQRALGNVNNSLKKIQRSSFGMGKALKLALGYIVALGAARLIGSVVRTIRTLEDLKATLVTIEGDAKKAAEAFELIRKFTAGTTFQLEEVSNAFITLRNAGLKPTQEMMTNLGNIAAGMGKRIDDVAKAVFNATTGEFEMLKQLGIKVKTQGDQLTVMFRGTSTQIKNDSASIVKYLQSIGEVEFAGAIDQRLNTLTGAFSNLKDAIAEAMVKIGEGGLKTEMTAVAKELTKWVIANEEVIESFSKLIGVIVREGIKIIQALIKNLALLYDAYQKIKQVTRDILGLNKDNIKLDDKRIKQLKLFHKGYKMLAVEINNSHDAVHKMMEMTSEETEKATASWKDWSGGFKDAMREFDAIKELEAAGKRTFNSLGDAVADMAMTGKFNFRDFANSVIRDLMRIAARKAIVAGFEMITGGSGSGGGSILGSIWGGVKKIFGFQHGGRMGAGQPGIVGEAGPELWMPDRAGTIVPGGMGAAMGGEVNVNFNISTVDATSFDELLLSRKSLIIGTIQQAFRQQGRRFV